MICNKEHASPGNFLDIIHVPYDGIATDLTGDLVINNWHNLERESKVRMKMQTYGGTPHILRFNELFKDEQFNTGFNQSEQCWEKNERNLTPHSNQKTYEWRK